MTLSPIGGENDVLTKGHIITGSVLLIQRKVVQTFLIRKQICKLIIEFIPKLFIVLSVVLIKIQINKKKLHEV